MVKLIRLELRKYRFTGYIRAFGIANLAIALLVSLIGFGENAEGRAAFANYPEVLSVIVTLVRATFVIFASVLLARFVIDEYKNKTITVLFTYPISRKKLIAAKLIPIGAFTFGAVVLSSWFVTALFCLVDAKFHFVSEAPTREVWLKHAGSVAIQALAAVGISLIALFFGMMKKSVPATIVTAVLIVSLLSSGSNGFSLGSLVAVSVPLALVGILLTYLSVRKIDKQDVA